MELGGQRHALADLPRQWPGTNCTGGWVGSGDGLNGIGKFAHYRDSILETSIPQRVAIPTELSRHRSPSLLTYYSVVQSHSWEANRSAASQEIPRISRNPKVHYRTHKRPLPVSNLGQPNPVHIHTSHPLEILSNIIHPSTPRSPQWSPSLRFPHQDPIHPLSSPIRATCPAHLILLDFITRTILGEVSIFSQSSLAHFLLSYAKSPHKQTLILQAISFFCCSWLNNF